MYWCQDILDLLSFLLFKKWILLLLVGGGILIGIAAIISLIIYDVKFGLPDEEQEERRTTGSNYRNCEEGPFRGHLPRHVEKHTHGQHFANHEAKSDQRGSFPDSILVHIVAQKWIRRGSSQAEGDHHSDNEQAGEDIRRRKWYAENEAGAEEERAEKCNSSPNRVV